MPLWVSQQIKCPLLVTHGAEDRIMSVAGAHRSHDVIKGSQIKVWTGAEGGAVHCHWDSLTPALGFMLDRLADQLR